MRGTPLTRGGRTAELWELASFAKGRTRRACLEALVSGPKTPTAIAMSSRLHLSHVSRALRELARRGLVECLTPTSRKNRIYRITRAGREVLERVRGVNSA